MANIVQFNVDDTSPTVSYFPFGDTFSTPNLYAGWNPYYDISGFSTSLGETGNGTSMHITSRDNASFSVQWQGTGIKLYGNATQAAYSVTLDGVLFQRKTDSSNSLLASITGLQNTNHTLSLTAHISDNTTDPPQSLIVFDKALLITPPPSDDKLNFTQQVIDDNDISFLGQWTFQAGSGGSFHQSNTLGDRARSLFIGTTLLIQGTTLPDGGNYSVNLDGITTHLSAKSSFTNFNTTLYFASGLDPEAVHSFEITNEDGSTLILPVGGATAESSGNPNSIPPPPSTTSSTVPSATSIGPSPVSAAVVPYPKGTIAALALAGILAFILLTGLLFFLFVYRPRRRRRQQHEALDNRAKEREAGVVLDIGPSGDNYTTPGGGWRGSGRGFALWKRQVEGDASRGDLGIEFRRSDSFKEKSEVDDIEDQPSRSERSSRSRFTPSPRWFNGNGKGKGKWGGRQHKGSSSPSFTIDLPPIQPHSRSGSHSNGGQSQMSQAPQDSHSGFTSLSYLTSPSINASDRLTFAAPHSRHNSSGFPESIPPPSTSSPTSHNPVDNHEHLHYERHAFNREPSRIYEQSQSHVPFPTFSVDMPSPREDRGSVRDYDDTTSVLGPATDQAAIRSLSPRTSEAEARHFLPVSVQQLTAGYQMQDSQRIPEHQQDRPVTEDVRSDDHRPYLYAGDTSPFTLDFSGPSRQRRKSERLSGQSHVRFEDLESLQGEAKPDKGKGKAIEEPLYAEGPRKPLPTIPKSAFRLTPLTLQPLVSETTDSDSGPVTSFLDFGANSDASTMGHSDTTSEFSRRTRESSISRQPQPKSRWSSTTAPASEPGQTDSSGESRSRVSTAPSYTFPFPVSLPASPHHPEGHKPSPPKSTPPLQPDQGSPTPPDARSHPADLGLVDSPTESVPVSIGDLNFRHSDSDDAGDPDSGPSSHLSHLPPHPPLPSSSVENEDGEMSTPTYVVQRVLGVATASSATFSHIRTNSGALLMTPVTPTPRNPNPGTRSNQGRRDP